MQSRYPLHQMEVFPLAYSNKLFPASYLPSMVLIDKVFLSNDIETVAHKSVR